MQYPVFKEQNIVDDQKIVRLATSYSPGSLRSKYHRRWRA